MNKITAELARSVLDDNFKTNKFRVQIVYKYIDQQEKMQNRINELLSECDLLEHKLNKREKLFALNNEYVRNNMNDYWLNKLGFERTYRTNKEILEDIEKLEKGLEDENNNDT